MALAGGLQANPALESFSLDLHAGEGFAQRGKALAEEPLAAIPPAEAVRIGDEAWRPLARSSGMRPVSPWLRHLAVMALAGGIRGQVSNPAGYAGAPPIVFKARVAHRQRETMRKDLGTLDSHLGSKPATAVGPQSSRTTPTKALGRRPPTEASEDGVHLGRT